MTQKYKELLKYQLTAIKLQTAATGIQHGNLPYPA